jgi:hypothetical protein
VCRHKLRTLGSEGRCGTMYYLLVIKLTQTPFHFVRSRTENELLNSNKKQQEETSGTQILLEYWLCSQFWRLLHHQLLVKNKQSK